MHCCVIGHNCTLVTSAVAKWFSCAWLQKFVNELALPTLQTLGMRVRLVKGKVAFTSGMQWEAIPERTSSDFKENQPKEGRKIFDI